MNMRKLIVKYAVLSIVLLLVGCGKEAEYAKVVPADVDVVVTFDCQRMMDESGLLSPDASDAQKKFLASFKKGLSAGESEFFDQLAANPSETGIDWSQKVYGFYQAETGVTALVMSVTDADKLKATVLTFSGSKIRGRKFSEEGGISWASTRKYDIAVADQASVVILSYGDLKKEVLKARVAGWLTQSKEDSFAASKYHDKLLGVDGEVAVYATMSQIPEKVSMLLNLAYSEEMDLGAMKYFAGISFEDGQLVAQGEVLNEDKKVEEWLKSIEKVTHTLKGKSLEQLPKTTPFWCSIGLKGDKLYDAMLEHPTYGKQMQHMSLPLDIEGVIRSINGDVTLAYPSGLFIDVKNNEILKICVGAITTMGHFIGFDLKELDEDQYEVIDQHRQVSRFLDKKDVQLHTGMKDETFYLLTSTEGTEELEEEASLAGTPWADDVDDNLLFIAYNFQDENPLFDKYSKSRKSHNAIKAYLDYVTYSQKDFMTNRVVLSLKDKERNIIEQLIEFLCEIN